MKKREQDENLAKAMNVESDLPPDADLEERFNDFWKKNGAGIFGGIALGAVLVVGVQGYQYMEQKRETGIQEAYAAAADTDSKLAFGTEHESHQLGAMALLQVADARYAEGAYAAAEELYERAKEGLTDSLLSGRAQIGQGMSLLMTGETAAGQAVLSGIAMNSGLLDQIRGEAAYGLMVSHWEQENLDGMRDALAVIEGLDNPGVWQMRALQIQDRVPELAADSES